MDEAVFSREHFDEGAELFDRDDATVIRLADFDLARHAADYFLRARHAFRARRVDVHGAVVFDINLRAGLGHDAFDRLAAGSDECTDFFRIDFDRLDPRRVLAQISARFINRARHDPEDLGARFLRAESCLGHDFVADARKFQVELEAGDAGVCAAKFEIHIAEMIFRNR